MADEVKAGRSHEALMAKFTEHDTNDSGFLSEDELLACLRDLGVLVTERTGDEAEEYERLLRDHFMERADANNDGKLSFGEFSAALTDWEGTTREEAGGAATTKPPAGRFAVARFEPLMVAAIANFVASIWEDVFDKTQADLVGNPHDHWVKVAAGVGHFVVVLLLSTFARFIIARAMVAAPRTRALCTMCVQILTGWGAKALLASLSHAFQKEMVGSSSYCEGWLPISCFLVCTCVAILMTGLAALTAFLPTEKPPRALGCTTLRLHMSALLAGATALPLGYAWHIAFDDLIRVLFMRAFSTTCDAFDDAGGLSTLNGTETAAALLAAEETARYEGVVEWLVETAVEIVYCIALALLCGWLKTRLKAKWTRLLGAGEGSTTTLQQHAAAATDEKKSATDEKKSATDEKKSATDEKKSATSRLAGRMQTLVNKSFDFVLAWAIFDIVAALFSSIDPSPCFPDRGGGLTAKWATLLVYTLLLLALALLKSTNGLGGFERCMKGPTTLCGFAVPAVAWGIALNTLGIQLGWSVHGLYAGLEAAFVAEAHLQHTAAVVLLAASVTTVIVIAAFHSISQLQKSRRSGGQYVDARVQPQA